MQDFSSVRNKTATLFVINTHTFSLVTLLYFPFQNHQRLKQIKDFHRTRPEDVTKPLSYEFEQMNLAVKQNEDLPNMVEFSDEEGYGRFLDLHEHYQRYVNIKGASRFQLLNCAILSF